MPLPDRRMLGAVAAVVGQVLRTVLTLRVIQKEREENRPLSPSQSPDVVSCPPIRPASPPSPPIPYTGLPSPPPMKVVLGSTSMTSPNDLATGAVEL
jgi:hypothetical protein